MTTNSEAGTIELPPSYRLSLGILAIAFLCLLLSPWLSLILALLGLFLFFQTLAIRLRFTPTALEVYRGDRRLRQFPYQDWQHWEIFWAPVPILFYFREVNSIHFLPILFNPLQLRTVLEQHCPQINATQKQPE